MGSIQNNSVGLNQQQKQELILFYSKYSEPFMRVKACYSTDMHSLTLVVITCIDYLSTDTMNYNSHPFLQHSDLNNEVYPQLISES